jgi:hypothetical protein
MADIKNLFGSLLVLLFFTALVTVVGHYWWSSCNTMPYSAEGFAGPVKGAGVPDCLRTLDDAAFLYTKLSATITETEEGPEDLREMKLLLSKLACFKRDLMGVAQLVSATKQQPFSTAHDLEPVAETTARCFAKTIPQRDLELSLEKWGTRGTFLIKRLCTAQNMSVEDEKATLELFGSIMYEIGSVATAVCCNASAGATIAGQPVGRGAGGFEPPVLNNLRKYEGYY